MDSVIYFFVCLVVVIIFSTIFLIVSIFLTAFIQYGISGIQKAWKRVEKMFKIIKITWFSFKWIMKNNYGVNRQKDRLFGRAVQKYREGLK